MHPVEAAFLDPVVDGNVRETQGVQLLSRQVPLLPNSGLGDFFVYAEVFSHYPVKPPAH
jgi:hypothetical protein